MAERKLLKKQRKACGFTSKEELCEELEINIETYKNIHNGGNAELKTLKKVADALNCSIDFLVGRSDYVHVDNEECSEITDLSDGAIEALRKWKSVPGWTNMLSDLIEGEDKVWSGKPGGFTVLSQLFNYTEPTGDTFKLHNARRKGAEPYTYEEEPFENNELAMIYDGGVYFLSTGYVSLMFRDRLMKEIDRYKSVVSEELRNKEKEGPAVVKSSRIRSDAEILKEVYAAFDNKKGELK